MTAIIECQIIPQNTIITWRIRSIENLQPQIKQTNKQIDTHIKLGFYDMPGSVIHLTEKRLNYQTKKISFSVIRTIIEIWSQIAII